MAQFARPDSLRRLIETATVLLRLAPPHQLELPMTLHRQHRGWILPKRLDVGKGDIVVPNPWTLEGGNWLIAHGPLQVNLLTDTLFAESAQ